MQNSPPREYQAHYSKLVFNNRPLLFVCVFLMAGITIWKYSKPGISACLWILLAGIVAAFAIYLFLRKPLLPICIVVLCASLLYMHTFSTYPLPNDGASHLSGRICELPSVSTGGYTKLVLDDIELNGERTGKKLCLYTESKGFLYGQRIDTSAKISVYRNKRNPGGMDERSVNLSRGIAYTAFTKQCFAQGSEKLDLYGFAQRIRLSAEEAVRNTVDDSIGEELIGMVLGDKSEITRNTMDDYRNSGLAHLLALSGLHVGFVAMALAFLLRKLRLKEGVIFIVTVAFLLMYCLLAGFSSSLVRAALMISILLLGNLFGRKNDSLTAMGAAALVLLLINPYQLFQPSFQLSFGAVLGIVLLNPIFSNLLSSLPKFLGDIISVSLSAQFGLLMIQLSHFGNITLLSFAANILCVPISAIVVVLGLLLSILGAIFLPLAIPLAFITEKLLAFISVVAHFFASLPFSIKMFSPSFLTNILYAFLIIVVSKFFISKKYIKRMTAITTTILLVLSIFVPIYQNEGKLKIIIFDIGQGDGAYIETPDGRNYFLDAGNPEDSGYAIAGERYLDYRGIGRLDGFIASHWHSDHTGGLTELLDKVNISAVYGPHATQQHISTMLGKKDIKIFDLGAGAVLDMGGNVRLRCIYPDADKEYIDESVVAILEYGSFKMLFTGDMETAHEQELLDKAEDIDILKVAHHGSANASSAEFLDILRPEEAVISVGARNTYGHPTAAALDRLSNAGCRIWRTDKDGAITITADENKYEIHGMGD